MSELPLVLVVEDYADTRELYRELLTQAGFRVAGAATGEEAIDKAFALHPDIIVMDLSLPGIDGWEATRRIRKDPRTQDVPIVALSGHVHASLLASARQAGCDAFLRKPCTPSELVEEIRRLLSDQLQPAGRKPGSIVP